MKIRLLIEAEVRIGGELPPGVDAVDAVIDAVLWALPFVIAVEDKCNIVTKLWTCAEEAPEQMK